MYSINIAIFQGHWDELQEYIINFDSRGSEEKINIQELSSTDRRKNISQHIFQAVHHFDKRVRAIFNYLKTPRCLGKYHIVDFFYRVEFQQRGKHNSFTLIHNSFVVLS